jgi:hypothetical protein
VKTKLWVLNLALIAMVVYAGVQFRGWWRARRRHETAILKQALPALKPPPFSALPTSPPVTPATYAPIALRTLFDPSRNPNVVVEPPPQPPPPVMPPLPLCFGVMNLGDGAAAILAENAKATHQFLHPGQTVGQFKLVNVNTEEIVLEWNGQEVRKPLVDMTAVAEQPQPQAQPQADNTPPPPPAPVKPGPGADTGRGWRICAMNDGVAEGAVSDGYKKVVYSTPFGQSCRYEPAQ